jgi:predicted nucleotidyltransferase
MTTISQPNQIEQIVELLKAYEPEKIYLFGSWARGESDELSDVDLVLIKQTKASFFERFKQICEILPENIGGIDILVYTPSEFEKMKADGNAFVEMILEEGRLIYSG